ncbi:MAG: DNA methyltransferase [Gammaproteobacteria bacterium]|nr:DNA methyltransferase [Gammaproteobacteria bacterium]
MNANATMKFCESDAVDKDCTIYHGDCIEALQALPARSVDLVFADPPYNLQLKQQLYRPNQTKVDGVDDEWDQFASFAEYDRFTERWLSACRRVMTDTATLWVIGSYHNIFRVGAVMLNLGFWILNDVQWHKTNPMPNFRGVRFTNATETLIWAKKSQDQKKYTFNHQTMKQLNGGKQMTSVWQIPLCTGNERIKDETGKKAHSTQKPEELLKRIILSSSSEGDVVLDPFLGSGTTCAVAKKLNRKSIGIEKERKYVKVAEKRIAAIDSNLFGHLRIAEPQKKSARRISMAQLVEADYIRESQAIYSKNGKHTATVLKDGTVQSDAGTGSIHKIAATMKGADNCNGWMYWYYEDGEERKLIDNLRQNYRAQNGIR